MTSHTQRNKTNKHIKAVVLINLWIQAWCGNEGLFSGLSVNDTVHKRLVLNKYARRCVDAVNKHVSMPKLLKLTKVCMFVPCCSGFPSTVQKNPIRLIPKLNCLEVWMCESVCVCVCQPCDRLVIWPGFSPPLTQWQLELQPVPPRP